MPGVLCIPHDSSVPVGLVLNPGANSNRDSATRSLDLATTTRLGRSDHWSRALLTFDEVMRGVNTGKWSLQHHAHSGNGSPDT